MHFWQMGGPVGQRLKAEHRSNKRFGVRFRLRLLGLLAFGAVRQTASLAASVPPPAADASTPDQFSWLEDIDSPRSLAWVEQHNAATAKRLTALPGYAALYRDALAVLESSSRVPEVTQCGRYLYNLWKDGDHPRGIYRRTSLEDFKLENPHWETVIDVDALARTEGKAWAFGGATWLAPDYRRALIRLAPGGGDAVEVREFDGEKLAFVEGGFALPTAKSRVGWRDLDTLFVATDFGPGSLTQSGYPRTVKLWKRGTPLSAAETLRDIPATSVSIAAECLRTTTGNIDLLTEAQTFWNRRVDQWVDGRLRPLALPLTATVVDGFRSKLVVWLKDDWTMNGSTFRAGSVVLADPAALRGEKGPIDLIIAPTAHEVVKAVHVTSVGILVAILDNVRGRLDRFTPTTTGWKREAIAVPDNGAVEVKSTSDETGDALVQYESFLIPPALYYISAQSHELQKLKSQLPTFDGSQFEVGQEWTTSADGTKIPYFVVSRKGMKRDGTNPVWMFSYGGFEVALTPAYSGSYEDLHGVYGKLWLERGGVFVLANIRGGGDFGPAWHQAALKENHVKSFEDFEAVARDLTQRRITSPAHLGIEGRSNGGLLVSATMLRHPELYGAVVCGNPLTDMQRYHHLLAGASWMAEYGDPDVPAEWAYLRTYSPYQNIQPGRAYPPILFYTSTRDDRVHPGHARKMAAKLETAGYTVDYYENTEGGHHGSVTNEQLATRLARTYAFLWQKLRQEAGSLSK